MRDVIDHEFGISAVDSGYLRPQLGAIHLIVENGRAAIIDCGVNDSVPRVLHAGDATGREIGRALWTRAAELSSVEARNHALVTDLVVEEIGRAHV